MIKEKDLKSCNLNEGSKGIFPTYFLLDLELSAKQKHRIQKLIMILEGVKKAHTPPPPKICSECGQSTPIVYMDTWWIGDHLIIGQRIDLLKKL